MHSTAEIKKLILRRVIPAQAGIHFCHLHYETIDPDLVSPTKIFNFYGARSRGDGFLFFASLNKNLSKYFLQFLFTKIVIPAQAGIGRLNRAQRAPIKYF